MDNLFNFFFKYIHGISNSIVNVDEVNNIIIDKEENQFNQIISYVNKTIKDTAKYTENRFCIIYESEKVPFYYFTQLVKELRESGYNAYIEAFDSEIDLLNKRRVIVIDWN